MPKVKTNSGAKKRFKVTATGKIKRQQAFHNHLLTKKSSKRKRRLRRSALVDTTDVGRIRRLLHIGLKR